MSNHTLKSHRIDLLKKSFRMQLMLTSLIAEYVSLMRGPCEQHGIQCTWQESWFRLQKGLKNSKIADDFENQVADDEIFSKINETPWYLINL